MSTWVSPPTELCVPWDISLGCCPSAVKFTEDEQAAIVLWASNELWLATGQRIGLCTSTVKRCRVRGSWWWWSPDSCVDCPPYSVIDLGPQWVTEVTSVKVNGTVLDKDDDWVVLDWRWLARVSGSWPDDEVEITYVYGQPPDPIALRNAEILACEEAKRRNGDKSCRLSRDRSSRRDGRFEIPEIDAWISIVNREDDCGIMAPERVETFFQVTSGS